MTKNLIDFEELLERTENDKDLMRDLLTIFKEEFPQRLQSLRDAEEWGYTSVVELLHEVDTALYAAKAAGRNCVKVAAPRAQSDSVRELAPEPAGAGNSAITAKQPWSSTSIARASGASLR